MKSILLVSTLELLYGNGDVLEMDNVDGRLSSSQLKMLISESTSRRDLVDFRFKDDLPYEPSSSSFENNNTEEGMSISALKCSHWSDIVPPKANIGTNIVLTWFNNVIGHRVFTFTYYLEYGNKVF